MTDGSTVVVRDFAFGTATALRARAGEWLSGAVADEPVVPRRAGTVALLRPAAAGGVEVFMLTRVAGMKFAPNTSVFPGGGVDPSDSSPPVGYATSVPGLTAAECWAYLSCAVREVYEETGVLLASPAGAGVGGDATVKPWPDPSTRARLESREVTLSHVLAEHNLTITVDELAPLSRWVTPIFEARRYDTVIWAARLPADQSADGDTSEAHDARWWRPADALAATDAGQLTLLPPTRWTLERFAACSSVEEALASATADFTPIMPVLTQTDADLVLRVQLPDDGSPDVEG